MSVSRAPRVGAIVFYWQREAWFHVIHVGLSIWLVPVERTASTGLVAIISREEWYSFTTDKEVDPLVWLSIDRRDWHRLQHTQREALLRAVDFKLELPETGSARIALGPFERSSILASRMWALAGEMSVKLHEEFVEDEGAFNPLMGAEG